MSDMYIPMFKIDIPEKPDHRREWIKYQLRLKGYSLGALSRELGLCRSAAKEALYRHYPKMERDIAEKLGLKPWEIWPERYDDQGRPIKHSPRYPRNDTTTKNRGQWKKTEGK